MSAHIPVPLWFLRLIAIWCCYVKIVNCHILQTNQTDAKAKESTLQLLHVIMRHGPRTPVTTYPNDPYINDAFYPFGWGQVTNEGKQELFKLGVWLRKRYRDHLGPYYRADVLHAQSTASPRTMMSLATVLASMFPPRKTAMDWNDKYNWQPIPILTEPNSKLLDVTGSCPRYDEALAEVHQLSNVQAEYNLHSDLFKELSQIAGMNVTTANDINSIFITLAAEQRMGLELPEWTNNYYPDKMEFMAIQNYFYNTYTTEMKRIRSGKFLQKMFDEWQQKSTESLKPNGRKVFMYCAHDWSITNILAALNVLQRQMPNFSAMALFELHKNLKTGEYYVEIYYKNKPTSKLEKLIVPGCEFQCPLKRFIELNRDVLPNGPYEKMCNATAA